RGRPSVPRRAAPAPSRCCCRRAPSRRTPAPASRRPPPRLRRRTPMALDMSPEQKAVGRANFHRAVGSLGEASPPAGQQPAPGRVTRRQFMQGLLAAGSAALPISAAAYFAYNNDSFRDTPVRAALIGAGDEGGVLVGEHNPRYLEFVAYSDIRPSNQRRIFEDERRTNPNSPRKGLKFHY